MVGGGCWCVSRYNVCEAAGAHGMHLCVEARSPEQDKYMLSHLAFPYGFWGTNSGLHGCAANTLLADLSISQPQIHDLTQDNLTPCQESSDLCSAH